MLNIDEVNVEKFGKGVSAHGYAEWEIYCDLSDYKPLPESNGCNDFVKNENIVYSPYIPIVDKGMVEITPELLEEFER